MADTLTSNYGFTKPEIGGSDDTWGNKLNGNWDKVDTLLFEGGASKVEIKNGSHVVKMEVSSAGTLEIFYNGVKIADLSSTGKLRVKGDVEGFAF
jgi:hypothetical protein